MSGARALGFGVLLVGALWQGCSHRASPSLAPADPRTSTATAGLATWSAVGTLAQPRATHTATLLGDGRVLVAGGSADFSVEVVDPRGSAFTRTAAVPMDIPRFAHTATMLLSGDVLFVGGDGAKTAEIFDVSSGRFRLTRSTNVSRIGHAAARLASGKVLIAGGAGEHDTTTEIYDPEQVTFSTGAERNVEGDGELVILDSGKVLFVGRSAAAEIFDPDTQRWTLVPVGPSASSAKRVALRLDGGKVLVSWATSATPPAVGFQVFDPATTTFTPPGAAVALASAGMSSALLPDGTVVLCGTTLPDGVSQTLVYDPVTGSVTDGGATPSTHHHQTTTVLPNGDVLVLGGDNGAADLRPWPGAVRPADSGFALVEPRAAAVGARLRDGTVLLAGGYAEPPTPPAFSGSAEIVDPRTKTSSAAGALQQPRVRAAAVTLVSGKVLLTGGSGAGDVGAVATAEIYDPVAKQSHAVAPMAHERRDHALTRLPGGDVLVTGGCDPSPCDAEIFDEATESFTSPARPSSDHPEHGAILLPTGAVLLVGGDRSELFDPATRRFSTTKGPPASSRSGRTARVLPSGEVFTSGISNSTIELFSPITDTWYTVTSLDASLEHATWALTPVGDIVLAGASGEPRLVRFDRLLPDATVPAVVHDAGAGEDRDAPVAWFAGAHVLVAGGSRKAGGVHGDAFLYGDGADDALRPSIDAVPATTMVGGRAISVTGQRFLGRSEDTPLAFWTPDTGAALVRARVLSFGATSLSILAPSSAFHGRGALHVVSAGVSSNEIAISLDPAQKGAACGFDAECDSGFCTDGVCCDARCDGDCFACSARRKLVSADGTCEPITAGTDPDGRCFAKQGQACLADETCAPNGAVPLRCVSGFCCDSPCVGPCLSCAVPGKQGTCVGLSICGSTRTCDGDHTTKASAEADVDCAPYKCAGDKCLTSCTSVNDCAGDKVCSPEGACVAAPPLTVTEETFLGCAVGPARPRSRGFALGAALAVALAFARAFARGRRS